MDAELEAQRNMLERVNREVRRRTRVVGAFPDGQSALMLVSARLRHIAGTAWGVKRYMKMDVYREGCSEEHEDSADTASAIEPNQAGKGGASTLVG